MAQLYARLRVASSRMELRCEQLQILSAERVRALVAVKFLASWTGKGGNVVQEDAHSEVKLEKVDGDWTIREIHYLKN